jgi:hypothetical protein
MADQITFDSIQTGQQLPGMSVPITASRIVAGAIATSDSTRKSVRPEHRPHFLKPIVRSSTRHRINLFSVRVAAQDDLRRHFEQHFGRTTASY